MTTVSRQVVLVSRPEGAPKESDFDIIETPLKTLEKGEVLLKTISFSLDPYMRGRMNESKSYVPPIELGKPIEGAAICKVLESKVLISKLVIRFYQDQVGRRMLLSKRKRGLAI